MMNYGYFETELQLRFADSMLYIRNMCDGGNTPGFRPHSGRESPWAFPGAEQYQPEAAKGFAHLNTQGWLKDGSVGHFWTPDQWLDTLKPDIVLAFFGYNESFHGPAGLADFRAELGAFIKHTAGKKYNGEAAPKLVLVSPVAFENLSARYDLPDGSRENENLALYADAMRQVADENGIFYLDVFAPTRKWFAAEDELTIDGSQMNDPGYKRFALLLADRIFGGSAAGNEANRALVQEAVTEKNWLWHNDFKNTQRRARLWSPVQPLRAG